VATMANNKIVITGMDALQNICPKCNSKSICVVLDGVLLIKKLGKKWTIKQVDIISPKYDRYHCDKCKNEWTTMRHI